MRVRVAMKVSKSWRPGAFKLFRTKLEREVPVELADKTKDVLLDNVKDFINANTNGRGRLADSMTVELRGQDMVIDSPLEYVKFVDEGLHPDVIPIGWLKHGFRGPKGGPYDQFGPGSSRPVEVGPSKAKGFVSHGVEMTRPDVLDLAKEVVDSVRLEAGL